MLCSALLSLSGEGFAQHADVFGLDRLRCVFDASASGADAEALPARANVTSRDAGVVQCAAPPSWVLPPPYLGEGAPVGLAARSVALRLALNGHDGSAASLPFTYYEQPALAAAVPAAGPVGGGTHVQLRVAPSNRRSPGAEASLHGVRNALPGRARGSPPLRRRPAARSVALAAPSRRSPSPTTLQRGAWRGVA